MRQLALCTAAAVLGSTITLVGLHHDWLTPSLAQGPGPRLSAPAEQAPTSAPEATDEVVDLDRLTPDEAVNVSVYESANRSVVNISTVSVRSDRFFLLAVPERGNGSGCVLDRSGHILTNYHVIEGARQIMVTLFNEESYEAVRVVGADPVNDIAVIEIKAPEEQLFPATFGDSEHLRVGMRVFALGNPFGLDRTMSVGVISSLNRSLEVRENWVIKSIIQIDASINPGNSGGPLLNSRGHVIGMNTAIATADARQSAGIGFAIPSSLIQRVVPELIQHGHVIRGDIGITHVSVVDGGLRIARLEPGGPAERAGLRGPKVTRRGPFVVEDRGTADIILAVDGEPVTSASEFLGHIESKKPGDTVRLSIRRQDRVLEIDVELGGEGGAGTDGDLSI
jgi:S1-C subfamily serine protease